MAAPQLPVNFDPGLLRGGGRSCVKNYSLGFHIEFFRKLDNTRIEPEE